MSGQSRPPHCSHWKACDAIGSVTQEALLGATQVVQVAAVLFEHVFTYLVAVGLRRAEMLTRS